MHNNQSPCRIVNANKNPAEQNEPCRKRKPTRPFSFQEVQSLKLKHMLALHNATQIMDTNPIKTAITVCSELIRKKVSWAKKRALLPGSQKIKAPSGYPVLVGILYGD